MKIDAAVVEKAGGQFVIKPVELEEPRADEVLVKIVATGICHTDIVAQHQHLPVPMPIVLGHEGAGIVEKVGTGVHELEKGDHVILTLNSCGECNRCRSAQATYCDNQIPLNFLGARADGTSPVSDDGEVIGGAFFGQSSFATYAIATKENTIKVPADLPLDIIAPLGCGVQTGAGTVMNALGAEMGSTLAVFGSGAVGMSSIMAAAISGCSTIIAIDIVPSRLELAAELGATHTLNSTKCDVKEKIQEITGGGLDYTVDTTGIPDVVRVAFDSLNNRGVCALVGASPPGTEVPIDMHTLLNGRTITGVLVGDSIPQVFILKLAELYRAGKLPIDRMIKHYAFSDINQAVEDAHSGKVIKPVLRM